MNGILIPYEVLSGKENMAKDEALLDFAIEKNLKKPILRFYGWSPACVSLGRNQSDSCVHKGFCISKGVEIVRRLTGGRALLHDNELTYSFVCPVSFLKNGETVIQSYKDISGAIAEGFNKLGINAGFPDEKSVKSKYEYCMSLATGADLSFENKKIVGSAQFRKQGYILQHGSILFDLDCNLTEKIFGEKPEIDKIALISEIKNLSVEDLIRGLKLGFEDHFSVQFIPSPGQNEEF